MAYLTWTLEERFHRGCFLIGRSLRGSLFVAKTLLTQWRGSLFRMRNYATEGSNREKEIDTEGNI